MQIKKKMPLTTTIQNTCLWINLTKDENYKPKILKTMEKYVSCVFSGRLNTVRIAVLPHVNLRNPNLIHNRTS